MTELNTSQVNRALLMVYTWGDTEVGKTKRAVHIHLLVGTYLRVVPF